MMSHWTDEAYAAAHERGTLKFSDTQRIRHAIIRHNCDGCREPIDKGDAYIRTCAMTKGDDKPHVIKLHISCG